MIQELFQRQQKQIEYFFTHIDQACVDSTIHQLFQCVGALFFVGVGKSGLIAKKLAATFAATGTKAYYLSPLDALHGDIGRVTSEDCVIFLSKSGNTEELLALCTPIMERGARLMAFVSSKHSPLEKRAHHTLHLPILEELCPFNLMPTTSTAIQLLCGNIIAVALMHKKGFTKDRYAANHPAGTIGKKATVKVGDLMLCGDRLPLCSFDCYLKDVLVELSQKQCGCLLITKNGRNLCGIFTDGDLRRVLQEHGKDALGEPIAKHMTCFYLSTTSDTLAVDALALMHKKQWVTVLPVVDDHNLVGLIRMHDIVNAGI